MNNKIANAETVKAVSLAREMLAKNPNDRNKFILKNVIEHFAKSGALSPKQIQMICEMWTRISLPSQFNRYTKGGFSKTRLDDLSTFRKKP